jgi:putative salt-induced outer membrane protein YdiY
MRSGFALVLLFLSTAPFARAESVVLKDGSTVTGDFQRLLGGNVIFKTNSMGTLTIPVANIAGFTSASTVMVLLKDGKRSDGIFSVTSSGAWQLQSTNATTTLPPGDVVAIYPIEIYMKENPEGHRQLWQDWTGVGALGYVLQQSSQDSKSLSINFNSKRIEPRLEGLPPRGRTTFGFNLAFATVTQSGVTNKANTLTSILRQDFFIGGNARNYLFAQGQWDHIQPQELSLRQTYGGGLGRDIIRRTGFTLSVQGGATYVRTKFEAGELRNEMEALAGEKIVLTLLNHLNINHEFDFYPSLTNSGDYRFNSITALDAPISKRFSFNVSLNDQFLSRPVPGTQSNVVILSTGLGINF